MKGRNMRNKFYWLIPILLILPFISFLFLSCDDSSTQPKGDDVSGYVTFTDTLLIAGGYYAISRYANKPNPFDTLPLSNLQLSMTKVGNVYKDYFKMTGIPSGKYYFAVTWIKTPENPNLKPPVLGTRGCDTNRLCTSHKLVEFPNYSYEDCNILSWTDTTKRLNHW
jgi:hypothetical protein